MNPIVFLLLTSAAAQCIPPPTSCPRTQDQVICHIENLWLLGGKFYTSSSFEPLPYTLTEHHAGTITIHRAPYVLRATEMWQGGLTVIHHRIFPHAYAHMMRDTIPQDLFAFRRFHTRTWDPDVIRPQLRLLYLDGQTTTHEGYRIHSDHPPWERTPDSLPDMFFARAVVGHFGHAPVDECNHHFFTPDDWQGYSDFLAQATLGRLPPRNPSAVWLANRNRGADRELLNADDLARALPGEILDHRPGDLQWRNQILLARTAAVIVGPHGANLANIVAAGTNVSVVEILIGEFASGWYAQQCAYQGARWFSSHDRVDAIPFTEPEGRGRCRADVPVVVKRVAAALGDRVPHCQFPFTAKVQVCT